MKKCIVLCITPIVKDKEENIYTTIAHVLPYETRQTEKKVVTGKRKRDIFDQLDMIELGLSV